MEVRIQKPRDLSPELLKSVFRLIAEGGEVNTRTLLSRLQDAVMVVYALADGEVIATGVIKKPTDNSVDNVFVKAQSSHQYEDFQLELGYGMVSPRFRGRGLGPMLCKKLCEMFQTENLYATTRASNYQAQRILLWSGFTASGRTFRNRTDTEDLKLFVREGTRPHDYSGSDQPRG